MQLYLDPHHWQEAVPLHLPDWGVQASVGQECKLSLSQLPSPFFLGVPSWQQGLVRQSCQSPACSIFSLVAETTFKAMKSEAGDSCPAGRKPLSGRPVLQPDMGRRGATQTWLRLPSLRLSHLHGPFPLLQVGRTFRYCKDRGYFTSYKATPSKLVATDGLVPSPQCCALGPSQWKDDEDNQPFPCKQKAALLLVNTLVI